MPLLALQSKYLEIAAFRPRCLSGLIMLQTTVQYFNLQIAVA